MPTRYIDHTPWLLQVTSANVKDFGAAIDGSTDDTTPLNNAIAALPSGGTVYVPEGTLCVSSAIKLTAGITIQGAGMGATTIKMLAAGAAADTFITNIPGSQGGAGGQTNRVAIRDLKIDCSNVTGGTAGAGNAIHFYGANQSFIERVWIVSAPNWGILIDSDSTNTSARNRIIGCVVDCAAGGGLFQTQYDTGLVVRDNYFVSSGTAAAANQGKYAPLDTTVYQVRLTGGYCTLIGNELGSGGTTTSPAVNISTAAPIRVVDNFFNACRYAGLNIAASSGGHTIANNEFSNCSATGTTGAITVSANNNTFTGNVIDANQGSAHYTYCVVDGASVSGNKYFGNTLTTGSSGFFSQNATSTNQIGDNSGLNPLGDVTAPAFPATTVAAANNTGFDVVAYITNGTSAITQIAIAGVGASYNNTGMNIAANGWGAIVIPAGGYFKATYAGGSPSWTFGAL